MNLLHDALIGVIFFVIANPHTFKITNALLKPIVGSLCSSDGCPTLRGLLVHSVVFAVIVHFLPQV